MIRKTMIGNSLIRNSLVFILLILSSTQFWGCSSTSITDGDPAALLKEAEEDIESDHYQIAIDKLRVIKNKYPYSSQAIDAQLRIADVYYMQDLYADAAASYETFRDLHPKHPKAAYAMYRVGKSYMNDTPSNISRDLTPAQKSLDAYSDFIRRFPTAPEVKEAQEDAKVLRTRLAEKELYVGDFYFKRNFYDSAKPRYQKIVDLFSDTDTAQKAAAKLKEIEEISKK